MKRYSILTCLILMLGALGFVSMAMAEDELPVLKVGHVGHDHQIALYVAADAGQSIEKDYGVYLKEVKPQEVYDLYEGGKPIARVLLIRVGGGGKMPAAMEQGSIEVGLGGLAPIVKFIDKGAQFKVIAPLNDDGDSLILGKSMKAKDWAGFVSEIKVSPKPVRIGYKDPLAVAYMILTRGLKEEGISYGTDPAGPDGRPVKVILVNLQELDQMLPSLESGIVDGLVANEPTPSMLVHKGVGRRVADLSSLPPKGKWEDHPCCVVAVTDEALKQKRGIIKALLKVIVAGGDIISRNQAKAIESELNWVHSTKEVATDSLSNVIFISRPAERWLSGVDTWLELMASSNQFSKNLKGKTPKEARSIIMDLGPLNEAVSGLPEGKKK